MIIGVQLANNKHYTAMAPDNTVQTLAKGSALTANKSSDQAVAPDVAASTLEEGLAKTADSPSHPAMIQRGTTGTSKEKATEKAKKANDNTISKPVTSANVKKASGRGKQKEQTTKNRQYKKRVRMTRKEAARKKEWLINHREAKYQHQMEEGEDVDDFVSRIEELQLRY